MPKIIENVREQLLAEAQKQIRENGYAGTTIRSVAAACGLGIGTVYNYFPSKDMLIASFMAEDWLLCLEKIRRANASESRAFLENMYHTLRDFAAKYHSLFSDSNALKSFFGAFAERHGQLRGQLADALLPLCSNSPAPDKTFLAEFIAESLLTWTMAGKTFEEQYALFALLIKA